MGRCKDFKEEEVLQKALDCFRQNGYEATSTRDLARAMGISYGSVYNTFRDKRTLFLAAIDQHIQSYANVVVQQLDNAASARSALSELLAQTAKASTAGDASCSAGNTIVSLAYHDTEVANRVKAMNDTIEQAIKRLLERAQRAGEINPSHDLSDTAASIINTISGIRLTAQLGAHPDKLRRIAEASLAVL